MIEVTREGAEIRCDRNIRSGFLEYIRLATDESDACVTAKTHPIDNQSWIVNRRCDQWHGHIRERSNDLPPKSEAEAFVETVDRFILGFEPGVPVFLALRIVRSLSSMGSNTVVDLPCDQLRVIPESCGHFPHDLLGETPIHVTIHGVSVTSA